MKKETVSKILIKTMRRFKISKEITLIIAKNLTAREQQQEMIDYTNRWSDIITDHQAMQHAVKIVYRTKQKN